MAEAVVAFSVVATLMANSVPALMKAREAARRAECKNNLKRYGLALHNYHDTFNSFPPAFVVRNWNSAQQQGFGWNSMLLPYFDQAQLYTKLAGRYPNPTGLNGGGLIEAAQNQASLAAMETEIPGFRCPSDVLPAKNSFRGGWPTSNYSGNAGTIPFPRIVTGTLTDYWPGQIPGPRQNGTTRLDPKVQKFDGIFAINSSVGIRDITDGTSNTLLVGERGASSLGGIWVGVTAASHENDVISEVSHSSRLNQSMTSFSSHHAGGLHFLLCDGAVRWTNDSIDSRPTGSQPMGVLQKLGHRTDGNPVNVDEF